MRRARNAPPVEGQFKCVCGFSHDLYDELLKHKRRTACDALYAEAIGQAEAALRAEEEEAERMRKKVRRDAAHDARKRSVSLELADLRYTKLVAGTHVDAMKAMHVKLTKEACASAMQQLRTLLGDQVDAEALDEIGELLHDEFDFYRELRSEYQERTFLQTFLPAPQVIPRQMPQGGIAYDFKIDEQLLLLLNRCKAARDQFYETLTSFRTEHPWTRDNPRRIIADVMDGDALRDHEIFGDAARMPREQAEKAAETGSMQFAISVWADGFVVRPPVGHNPPCLPCYAACYAQCSPGLLRRCYAPCNAPWHAAHQRAVGTGSSPRHVGHLLQHRQPASVAADGPACVTSHDDCQ